MGLKEGKTSILQSSPQHVVAGRRRAIDVEDLVRWTYGEQLAGYLKVTRLLEGEAIADGETWGGASGDGIWQVLRQAILGIKPDGTGVFGWSLHPDAQAVHEAVESLGGEPARLLMRYGHLGTRPEWLPRASPRLEPVWKDGSKYDARGLPKRGSFAIDYPPLPRVIDPRVIDRAARSRLNHAPYLCPLRLVDPPEYIASIREHYTLWCRALAAVQVLLARRGAELVAWFPTGPAAPPRPWRQQKTA